MPIKDNYEDDKEFARDFGFVYEPDEKDTLFTGALKSINWGASAFPQTFYGVLSKTGIDAIEKKYQDIKEWRKSLIGEKEEGIQYHLNNILRTTFSMGSHGVAGPFMLQSMSVGAGLEKYEEGREMGLGKLRSAIGGGIAAVGEYVGEMKFLKIIKNPGLKFIEKLWKGMIADIGGEYATALIETQIANRILGMRGPTLDEYVKIAKDIGITELGTVGLVTTATHPFVSGKFKKTPKLTRPEGSAAETIEGQAVIPPQEEKIPGTIKGEEPIRQGVDTVPPVGPTTAKLEEHKPGVVNESIIPKEQSIINKIKQTIAKQIKLDQSFYDHFGKDEAKEIFRKYPGFFSKKASVTFDEVANDLGITTDKLADKFRGIEKTQEITEQDMGELEFNFGENLIESYKETLTPTLKQLVNDNKLDIEDAVEIGQILKENNWSDKELDSFAKTVDSLGVTRQTPLDKLYQMLEFTKIKEAAYKTQAEKYKNELEIEIQHGDRIAKMIKIKGGAPDKISTQLDSLIKNNENFNALIKQGKIDEIIKLAIDNYSFNFVTRNGTIDEKTLMTAASVMAREHGLTIGETVTEEQALADAVKRLPYVFETVQNMKPGEALGHADHNAIKIMLEALTGNVLQAMQTHQLNPKNEALKVNALSAMTQYMPLITALEQSTQEMGRYMRFQQLLPGSEKILDADGIRKAMESIANLGKEATPEQIAEAYSAIQTKEQVTEAARLLSEPVHRKAMDMLVELYINGLVSGFPTHVVNIQGGLYTLFSGIGERALASRLHWGKNPGVVPGEASQMLYSFNAAFHDALKAMKKMWQTGVSTVGGPTKIEHKRAITARNVNIMRAKLGLNPMSKMSAHAIDFIGSMVNLPARSLMTTDEFFKMFNYRIDLQAQAFREVTSRGIENPDHAKSLLADLVLHPTRDMRLNAMRYANVQTMTAEAGTIGQMIMTLTSKYPLAKMVVPFWRAPENLLKYGFDRFPGLNMIRQDVRNNLFSADAATRDMELGKMAFGGMTLGLIASLAASGLITGAAPKDPELRRVWEQENQEYSIWLGKWVSFKRFDFMLFGLMADFVHIARNMDEDTAAQTGMAIYLAFRNNLVNRTYLDGIMNVIEAIEDPGQGVKLYKYLKNVTGSFVPSIVALSARVTDPVIRDVVTITDKILSRTPGASQGMPAVINMYGEKVMRNPVFGPDWLSPIYLGMPKNDPVFKEILDNEIQMVEPARWIAGRSPGFIPSLTEQSPLQGIGLTPRQYEAKKIFWGQFLKERLPKLINTAAYKQQKGGPDGGKANMFHDANRDANEYANMKLLQKHPELKQGISEKKLERRRALLPARR